MNSKEGGKKKSREYNNPRNSNWIFFSSFSFVLFNYLLNHAARFESAVYNRLEFHRFLHRVSRKLLINNLFFEECNELI